MKGIICITIFMLITAFALGQNPKSVEGKELKEMTTTPPDFTGIKASANLNNWSTDNLQKYLMSVLEGPALSVTDGAEGTEVVQFTVTSQGKITNLKVLNSVSDEIDREVISAIRQTEGMWIPGKSNNNPVDMEKEVSLVFISADNSGKSTSEHFTNLAKDFYSKGNTAIFEKGNAKKAVRYYSMGIRYLPHDPGLLYMRGLCRYETGDKKGAVEDWKSGYMHGGIDMSNYETAQLNFFKGYFAMIPYTK